MNVTCQDCRSVFRVDPAKVPPNGVRARCSVCGAIVRISVGAMTPLTNPAVSRQTPLRQAAISSVAPAGAPAVHRPMQGAKTPVAPLMPYPSRPTPSISTPGTPLVPPPPPSPGQLVSMSAPTPSSSVGVVPGVPGDQRRVINPFLRSDPMTRAKRLARALVSDMVAYQPQKRSDGLANGTLKALFRDEIRKSYDEYVEQVGREVAESTAFFQDALNEVLAEGKRVF